MQIDTNYELKNGVEEMIEALSRADHKYDNVLNYSLLETPLGSMMAIADEDHLYLLEFIERRKLEHKIKKLCLNMGSIITPGKTSPIALITEEVKSYFDGHLRDFKTPLRLLGTPFQNLVWEELMRISYGYTRSYSEHAIALKKETAYRAVANVVANNQFAVLIPCHRVIYSDGNFGHYAGGRTRKKWLIEFERSKI